MRPAIILLACLTIRAVISVTDRGPIDGAHLQISAIYEVPLMYVIRDPKNISQTQFRGFSKDLIDVLSNKLRFTYTFVTVDDAAFKKFGVYQLSMQMLQDKKVDMASTMLAPNAERLQVVDFSGAVMVLPYVLLQPMPEIESRLLATVKPFSPEVWLSLTLTMMGVISTLSAIMFTLKYAMSDAEFRDKNNSQITAINAIYVISVLIGQGGSAGSPVTSFRLAAISWCAMSLILATGYNGALTSRLSAPRYEPLIDTFKQLAASDKRLAVGKGTNMAKHFLEAKTGPDAQLGKVLREHPQDLVVTDDEILNSITSGCCAMPMNIPIGNYHIVRSLAPGGRCRMTIGNEMDFFQSFSFAIAKDSPYRDQLNKQILNLWANGVISKMQNDYSMARGADKCKGRVAVRAKNTRLSLVDLSSPFIILIIGLVASLTVFAVEMACGACAKRRRSGAEEPPRPRRRYYSN